MHISISCKIWIISDFPFWSFCAYKRYEAAILAFLASFKIHLHISTLLGRKVI